MAREPELIQDLSDAEKAAMLERLVDLTRRGHGVAAVFKLERLAGVEDERGLQWPKAPWEARRTSGGGSAEADAQIARGEGTKYGNLEDFLADLD